MQKSLRPMSPEHRDEQMSAAFNALGAGMPRAPGVPFLKPVSSVLAGAYLCSIKISWSWKKTLDLYLAAEPG
jgi:hypothetical protein